MPLSRRTDGKVKVVPDPSGLVFPFQSRTAGYIGDAAREREGGAPDGNVPTSVEALAYDNVGGVCDLLCKRCGAHHCYQDARHDRQTVGVATDESSVSYTHLRAHETLR